MSSIYVLRHGQSVANANPIINTTMFNSDIPLSIQGVEEAAVAAKTLENDITQNGIAVFSSNYHRAIQTAELIAKTLGKRKVQQNIFLAERQYGDQDGGSDVENFETRPIERKAYKQAGHLMYRPSRGESLLDVQMRVALFVLQQDSFQFVKSSIIISHASTCLMFHSYFTGEVPTIENKWANCEIRKYQGTSKSSLFTYEGKLDV